MDTAPDLSLCEICEEAFNLVDPRRRSRRQMDMPVGALGQPGPDPRRFMGGVIVHDQVNVQT